MAGSRVSISVAVPTFGRTPAYLEEALRSVTAAAGYPHEIELCVVENGGPYDSVTEVLSRLADPAIRRLSFPEVLPVAANWNRCIAACTGHWIHILHDDDYVALDFHRRLLDFANGETEPDLIACACTAVNPHGRPLGYCYRLEQKSGAILPSTMEAICAQSLISCAAVMVRRDAYEKFGGFDLNLDYAVDWECWGRIILKGDGRYLDEQKCCYRVHPQNITSQSHSRLLYRQTQQVAIALRRLFQARLGAYPSSSLTAFPLQHAWMPLRSAVKRRDLRSLVQAGLHFITAALRFTLPQLLREAFRPNPRHESSPS